MHPTFPGGAKDRRPLPKPNVAWVGNDTPPSQFTVEQVRGMTQNPIYAGVPPFPALLDDALWVGANINILNEVGPRQYLVNLLHILRETFSKVGDDDWEGYQIERKRDDGGD